MRITLYLLISFFLVTEISGQTKRTNKGQDKEQYQFIDEISDSRLRGQLHFITGDLFQGRAAGSVYERDAAAYIALQYWNMDIPAISNGCENGIDCYFQKFNFSARGISGSSQNILAFLEGSDPELKEEVIVLTAHYDHIGIGPAVNGDSIYNGAADDGSGTVAMLEIARALKVMKQHGITHKRSILLLHLGAEEVGLQGSNYFVKHQPLIELNRIKAVINMDGVAGTDRPDSSNANGYLYLLQVDSTSSHLAKLVNDVRNLEEINLNILHPLNPQRFMSDSKPFEYELIPTVYFSTGLIKNYHQPDDEAHTVDYTHFALIAKLILATTFKFSNESVLEQIEGRKKWTKSGSFFCPPCGCQGDKKVFSQPGICQHCHMPLEPQWRIK